MKKLLVWLGLSLALAGLARVSGQDTKPAAPSTPPAAAEEVAVLKFKDHGEIVLEFWSDVAPKTVENFKKLSKDKFYDGTLSHRLIPGFMIQLGDPLTKDPAMEHRWGTGDPGYKIKAEFNEKPHVKGVVSMARSASPDSAGSQFFICFATASNLDRQYTAFGRVVEGMEVLEALEKIPVGGPQRSKPQKPVVLESITIVSKDSRKK